MRTIILSFLLPIFVLVNPGATITLKGKVVSAGSQKPVTNVLVYVIEGEEESLTNSKGEFTIRTRKAFPFGVTAQQLSGKKTKVRVTANTEEVTIEMP